MSVTDAGACSECGGADFRTTTSDLVCVGCGSCMSEGLPYGLPFNCFVSKPTYVRLFHHNERMGQWIMAEPAMEDWVYEAIEDEFYKGNYGPAEHLNKGDIRLIVKNAGLSTR